MSSDALQIAQEYPEIADRYLNLDAEFMTALQASDREKMDRLGAQMTSLLTTVQQRKAREASLTKRLKRAAIPEALKDRDFDNFTVMYEPQRQVVDILRGYAQNFEKVQSGPTNMALIGPSRRGKDHLAVAVANRVMRQGHHVLYARGSEIWRTIRSTYSRNSNMSEEQVVKSFSDPNLLVISELGRETGDKKKAAEMVGEVFNARHESRKPTLLVTNLKPTELEHYLGEHNWYRLQEHGGLVVDCNWPRFQS